MKKAAAPSPRWYAVWRARPTASRAVDPADLGTAYGLDLSIPEHPELPAPRLPPARLSWRARWDALRRAG